jgi:hypothetical protein
MFLPPLVLAVTLTAEPALVELFSSEGCSSCPPAESLLRAQAAADPSLLVLEFHVDYWNSLGWSDPFSSAAFSERQSRYAAWLHSDQVYTPQAIVDGREAFIGSDAAKLKGALRHAATAGKRPLSLEVKGNALEISAADAPAGDLWVVVTEADLETHVRRGENAGRTLQHAPVVRAFKTLGAQPAGPLARHLDLQLDPSWRRDNLRIMAAVQDPGSGRILALGSVPVVPH